MAVESDMSVIMFPLGIISSRLSEKAQIPFSSARNYLPFFYFICVSSSKEKKLMDLQYRFSCILISSASSSLW